MDETNSESDQLEMDQLSGLKHFDWMLENTSTPFLQSARAAYNFSGSSPCSIGVTISRFRRCRERISSTHDGRIPRSFQGPSKIREGQAVASGMASKSYPMS